MEVALQADANALGHWTRARENACLTDVVAREWILNQSTQHAHSSRWQTAACIGEALDAAVGDPDNVISGEPAARTDDTTVQLALDGSAFSSVKTEFKHSVIADVSNAAGPSTLGPTLARAALAVGADGITVSVREQFPRLVERNVELSRDACDALLMELGAVAQAAGRTGGELL